MSYRVVAYQKHIGLIDPDGCSILNVLNQGSVEATLILAGKVADALNMTEREESKPIAEPSLIKNRSCPLCQE